VATVPIYQVDAFTNRVFGGNPAAVCPLGAWLPGETLQSIAAENNLSETAFFVTGEHPQSLRWFTPTTEVELCGHATLASAFVLFQCLGDRREAIIFETRKHGSLSVRRAGDALVMDFPRLPPEPCTPSIDLAAALRATPETVLATSTNYLCVFSEESTVRGIAPDFAALAESDRFGIIVTAPGDEADFVSRFFAPSKGIPEDPVTGSAHCALTPYWARRLDKPILEARQVSARGGVLQCEDRGERVSIGGQCALYLEGTIRV